MNKSLTLTVRMPAELKKRLEREAKYQGVSLNQLTNYMLTIQLTQLETISAIENKYPGIDIFFTLKIELPNQSLLYQIEGYTEEAEYKIDILENGEIQEVSVQKTVYDDEE